ncbi:MAG: septum formation initiator family protein [Clostridiales bacterium]|nr:septum formation initiator family protein [Clostridiales bacterium]
MKLKKAGFLTKIVVLALLIAASVGLLRMQGCLTEARNEREELKAQVAEQTQRNADLQDAVENSDDPERQADIARDKLGLAAPGEKVIIFTD